MSILYSILGCSILKNIFYKCFQYIIAFILILSLCFSRIAKADDYGAVSVADLSDTFEAGGIYILPNDTVLTSQITAGQTNGIEIQLNDYNISAAL